MGRRQLAVGSGQTEEGSGPEGSLSLLLCAPSAHCSLPTAHLSLDHTLETTLYSLKRYSTITFEDPKNLGQPSQVASKYAGKRLLIVDDETDMRLLLAAYFRRLGFQVEERDSGAAALEPATSDTFDCFIFDVSMPGISGFELLKRVRERGVQTPTIFLTAHDALDYKVAGYEAGADDYLGKPFNAQELELRVEALLKRTSGIQPETNSERVQVGGLVIDKRRHEVVREGARIDLTPLEFQILELLASEPGRAWSRNDLLDRVWSTEYEGYQRNIDPHINRLRKKLETDPKNPRYVLTVRGVGYKLNEAP